MNFIQKCERNEEEKKCLSMLSHLKSIPAALVVMYWRVFFFFFVLLPNWELAEGRTRSSSSLNVGFCAHFCCFFVVVVEWN